MSWCRGAGSGMEVGAGRVAKVAREVREVGRKASKEEARARELWSTNGPFIANRRFCSTIFLSLRFLMFSSSGALKEDGQAPAAKKNQQQQQQQH